MNLFSFVFFVGVISFVLIFYKDFLYFLNQYNFQKNYKEYLMNYLQKLISFIAVSV